MWWSLRNFGCRPGKALTEERREPECNTPATLFLLSSVLCFSNRINCAVHSNSMETQLVNPLFQRLQTQQLQTWKRNLCNLHTD